MEELMLKLAELLEVTVESAIDLYPILKSQFVWYKILSELSFVNMFFTVGAIALLIIGGVKLDTAWDDKERKLAHKILKIGMVLTVVVVIAWITIIISTNLIAPDIVFIKDMLN